MHRLMFNHDYKKELVARVQLSFADDIIVRHLLIIFVKKSNSHSLTNTISHFRQAHTLSFNTSLKIVSFFEYNQNLHFDILI